jgi:hypothetical protein
MDPVLIATLSARLLPLVLDGAQKLHALWSAEKGPLTFDEWLALKAKSYAELVPNSFLGTAQPLEAGYRTSQGGIHLSVLQAIAAGRFAEPADLTDDERTALRVIRSSFPD